MIERKFVQEKIKEFKIEQYISEHLKNVGHSHTKMIKTPLGEKIVIFASRPGLIVGRKGQNIKELTKDLKKKFNLENPQIEISEVENVSLDAKIVAEKITDALERYGSEKFKAIGHKMMEEVMKAGALGVELIVSGKIPSDRAKRWRFYQGYLKKCGNIAVSGVNKAMAQAHLKTGVIGVQVSIMPPDTKLPDRVTMLDANQQRPQQAVVAVVEERPKKPAKKARSKKTKDKSEAKEEVAEKEENEDQRNSEPGQ